MKTASQNLTKFLCIFLSLQMVLMPIVFAAEELEQMASSESEQSVSSDSQNLESNVTTEKAENKAKPVNKNLEESTEPKKPEDENKNPEEKEPENKIEGDNPTPNANTDDLLKHQQSLQQNQVDQAKMAALESRGKGDVNLQKGAFTYQYTFKNGLKPPLSLSYNSHSAKGVGDILPAGWSLSLSYVARNPEFTFLQTELQDDTFDLILNGSPEDLIYLNSNGNTHNYRARRNASIRVKATGYDRYNPDSWEVTTGDGTIYSFGGNGTLLNNDANISRDYIMRWYLDTIQDKQTTPNITRYHYSSVNTGPANKISTSDFESQGVLFLDAVTFRNYNHSSGYGDFTAKLFYEPRSTWAVQYLQGLRVRNTYRLSQVKYVYKDHSYGQAIETEGKSYYQLSYDDNSYVCGGLLKTIQEIPFNGSVTPLPPVTFTYNLAMPADGNDVHEVYEGILDTGFIYFNLNKTPGYGEDNWPAGFPHSEFDYSRYTYDIKKDMARNGQFSHGINYILETVPGNSHGDFSLDISFDINSPYPYPSFIHAPFLLSTRDTWSPTMPDDCQFIGLELQTRSSSSDPANFHKFNEVVDIDNDGYPDLVTYDDINSTLGSYDRLNYITMEKVGPDGWNNTFDDNIDAWMNWPRRPINVNGINGNVDDFIGKSITYYAINSNDKEEMIRSEIISSFNTDLHSPQ